MLKMKKLCVYGVAVISLGASYQAAQAQCGTASWYHEGSRTATGERYNPDGITAAHRSLPFGTRVQVRNQRTGRTVVVRINDRGPFIRGRIIDLSRGAHRLLGMDGLAPVCLAVLGRGGTTVASADEGESRSVRTGRTRSAVYGETRSSGHRSRSRLARLRSERRIAGLSRSARERRAEIRLLDRQSRRLSARSERRLREAAAERSGNETGL